MVWRYSVQMERKKPLSVYRAQMFLAIASVFIVLCSYGSFKKYSMMSCYLDQDVDIIDAHVLQLEIPDRPSFPLQEAWLKCETARYGKAPKTIPQNLVDSFTLNGSIPVEEHYFDQVYLGGNASMPIWTKTMIQDFMQKVKRRHPRFNYDTSPIYALFDTRPTLVSNKVGLVVGSENPWLESLLLYYGAKEVHTLEFGSIKSEDERIKTFTPETFKLKFLKGDIPRYDFAFSYSSLEHDGLGRYGDVLNPSGDLHSMAKLLSVVKPGGHVIVGIPCCHDRLDWNAHRIYGPIRLEKLFAGFKVLGVYPKDSKMTEQTGYSFQPVWLLMNQLGCKEDLRVVKIFSGK